MELIDQRTKAIMEECKKRARQTGLSFDNETLEYIVTNRDLIEISPKGMIPTLYDYWVNDVEVLKGHGRYQLYPSNPYETVINGRPAISFYNDNNPDWLNVMIFYHVIAHIDFFQNNILFTNTWNDDFVGQALADKRLLANLRSEYGRWVDYIIEFSRSIDNIPGYFSKLAQNVYPVMPEGNETIKYYFERFLQEEKKLPNHEIYKEVEKYNALMEKDSNLADSLFLSEIKKKYPEFPARYKRHKTEKKKVYEDLLQFIRDYSPFVNKEENQWMRSVMTVIRNTALYFAPQIRTKIMNEGWASYWHDKLFIDDPRVTGHESDYARVNAKVTSLSRVGLNPYAIGLRLFEYIEELAHKGKLSIKYQRILDIETRQNYNKSTGKGKEAIFKVRSIFSDYLFIKTFIDQDFIDKHRLFVAGKRLDKTRGVIQYYVKSRKAEDYKNMLLDALYHPPKIVVDLEKTSDASLYIIHQFENKQLVKEYISDVLIGLEFLWGNEVNLETTEILEAKENEERKLRKVLYTARDKKINRKEL